MITAPADDNIPADLQKIRDRVKKQLALDEQKLIVIREAHTSQRFAVQDAIKQELGLKTKIEQKTTKLAELEGKVSKLKVELSEGSKELQEIQTKAKVAKTAYNETVDKVNSILKLCQE